MKGEATGEVAVNGYGIHESESSKNQNSSKSKISSKNEINNKNQGGHEGRHRH